MLFGVTLIPLPDFQLRVTFLCVAANDDFHAQQYGLVCAVVKFRKSESERQTRQTQGVSERDGLIVTQSECE